MIYLKKQILYLFFLCWFSLVVAYKWYSFINVYGFEKKFCSTFKLQNRKIFSSNSSAFFYFIFFICLITILSHCKYHSLARYRLSFVFVINKLYFMSIPKVCAMPCHTLCISRIFYSFLYHCTIHIINYWKIKNH